MMIPYKLVKHGLPITEHFFLVEKPGLDVAIGGGVKEGITRDKEDNTNCI
jgi:hypothetical protein